MSSEKLTRLSGGWLLLVLVATLAIAMVLSITFAHNAEAKKNRTSAPSSTFVFCNPNTFDQCTNTIDPSEASQTFTGSGTMQTNNVSFRSRETEKDFSSCVFFGKVSDTDEYVCKTKATTHKHRKHRH
ncbi:MAG: hypothetical protein QOI57_2235 [Rubrobacteraceae bacterium]|nr:hypothetical protein [Rubrobacteraceae bacterium]